ncbi:hypothetical protein LPB140_11120 [Sphingorhabdus lutea]|uniref:Peptidase S74 domain-containing protein n=2 Tax=Sphingorhabdus lutea TaxID=1913578 RepID=A0A1L3JDR0_9SPHN|nr:hypothetical protein LPB140_11120 [Sphingorhabdus lutea]
MSNLFFADLIGERTNSEGLGEISLDGAIAGHRRFTDNVPAGQKFHYAISGITKVGEWEVGEGQLTQNGALNRVVIFSSSANGAKVDFTAGLKMVVLTPSATWFMQHGHDISSITGLQSALDGKQAAGSYSLSSHIHPISSISGLSAQLANCLTKDANGKYSSGTGFNITSTGKVGIGTDSPAELLEVHGTSPYIVTNSNVLNNRGGMKFKAGGVERGSVDFLALVGELKLTAGYANWGGRINFNTNGMDQMTIDANGGVYAARDNQQNLGHAGARWASIFAGSGAINTSDENAKKHIGKIPDCWIDAWGDVQWQRYRFRGGKRWHAGLIAQRVFDAFAARGLDAFSTGLCCRDEIGDVDKDGETHYRWGLRYDECFAMEAVWQRREFRRLSEKLAAIENRLAKQRLAKQRLPNQKLAKK